MEINFNESDDDFMGKAFGVEKAGRAETWPSFFLKVPEQSRAWYPIQDACIILQVSNQDSQRRKT